MRDLKLSEVVMREVGGQVGTFKKDISDPLAQALDDLKGKLNTLIEENTLVPSLVGPGNPHKNLRGYISSQHNFV